MPSNIRIQWNMGSTCVSVCCAKHFIVHVRVCVSALLIVAQLFIDEVAGSKCGLFENMISEARPWFSLRWLQTRRWMEWHGIARFLRLRLRIPTAAQKSPRISAHSWTKKHCDLNVWSSIARDGGLILQIPGDNRTLASVRESSCNLTLPKENQCDCDLRFFYPQEVLLLSLQKSTTWRKWQAPLKQNRSLPKAPFLQPQ